MTSSLKLIIKKNMILIDLIYKYAIMQTLLNRIYRSKGFYNICPLKGAVRADKYSFCFILLGSH